MTSIASKLIVTEKIGRIFLIGINRPEKRNCINRAASKELLEAFSQFENDDSADVAVLHGKEGTFCAGYDLTEIAQTDLSKEDLPLLKAPMGPSHMTFTKPTIAAVAGYAVAGGLELALMCDLRVMEESAIMGVFCRRFGVPLIDGGTVRLPKLIGLSRALDLILTGRLVTAKEAFEMGLANRVVKNGIAVGIAVQLAQEISRFPQGCLRADRRSAYYSTFKATSLKDALDFEFTNGVDFVHREGQEGASKFISGVGRRGSFGLSGQQSSESNDILNSKL